MERAGDDLLSAVVSSLPAHTAVLDRDGVLLAVNRAWRRFAADNGGSDDSCGPGASYLAVCEATVGRHRSDALAVARGIREVLSSEVPSFATDYDCSSAQEELWFQVLVVPLRDPGDESGPPRGAVVTHSDITVRKLGEAALLHQATHDPLTGLLNRTALLAELRREMHHARQDGLELSVLYLDLDGLKSVNDSLGHRAGDELLRVTADRLCGTLRPGDHLARLGGDEFVVVLPRTPAPLARRLARRLSAAVRRPVELDEMPVAVTVSIGVAGSRGAVTPEELLSAADSAMYRAKQHGRSRTEVFEGDLRARAEQRTEVEGQLTAALALGQLQLFRQPVVDLGSGARVGGEALLRWFTSEGSLRSPASFLDLTAHAPVARAVTRAVLASAAGEAGGSDGGRVSVNVGLPDLRDPSLVEDVLAVCDRAGLPPSSLTLEVSEQAVMVEPYRAHRVLASVRACGARVALDAVGPGGCPPSLLATLPLDEVKLDRSVTAALDRPPSRAVAHGLAVMAEDLGLRLVACGVQSSADLSAVSALGVRYGQGWALGPPEPWTVVQGA